MAKMQLSLKARALRYLSAREHSRLELGRKLAAYAQEGDDVEALLDQLQAAALLSQERFCETLVRRRAARFGNSRILMELQSHGITGQVIAEVRQELTADEAARASAVLARKYGVPPADAGQRAKYMRFLQQRGFSHAAIQAAIKALEHHLN
ncbi:MAG: recombination regulator RecX [Burkholderiaceae bacterium]|nr:recombination regulator RecX [Burkholderiaceae bacterium]